MKKIVVFFLTVAIVLGLIPVLSLTASYPTATTPPSGFEGTAFKINGPDANGIVRLDVRAYGKAGNIYKHAYEIDNSGIEFVKPNGTAASNPGQVLVPVKLGDYLPNDEFKEESITSSTYGWADLMASNESRATHLAPAGFSRFKYELGVNPPAINADPDRKLMFNTAGISQVGVEPPANGSGVGLYSIYFKLKGGRSVNDLADDLVSFYNVGTDAPSGTSIIYRGEVATGNRMWLAGEPAVLASPVIIAPATGATVTTKDVPVSGTAAPGATVNVTVTPPGGGAPITATVTADPTGAWSTTVTAPIDGAYTVAAGQTKDGVTSPVSTPTSFTVDAVSKPVAPTITSPTTGSTVPDKTVPVTGTGVPGAIVTASVTPVGGGTPVTATGTVQPDGTWTIPVTVPTDGSYTVTAAQEKDGETSDVSTGVTITVDSVPTPIAPTITAPTAGSTVPNKVVPVTGTGVPGATVTATVTPVGGGTPVTATTTVNPDGSWSVPVTLPGDGSYAVTATQTKDGKTGPASTPSNFTVDNPEEPLIAPTVTSPTAGTVVPSKIVPVTGTGVPGATVTATITPAGGGTPITSTGTVNPDGTWSVPVTVPGDGSYTVTAAQTKDGVTSPASTGIGFTVDSNTAPTAPIITSPTTGQGVVGKEVPVTGTGIPGATITATITPAGGGTPVTATTTVKPDGTWTLPITVDKEGSHTVNATQNKDGETSPVGPGISFTVKPISPTVTSPTPGTTVPGKEVTITGTGVPGAIVTGIVTPNGGGTPSTIQTIVKPDGTWAVVVPVPGTGGHTVTAVQETNGQTSPPSPGIGISVGMVTNPPSTSNTTGPTGSPVVPDPTGTNRPTTTANPTNTSGPTATAVPTATARPTSTPRPVYTNEPTYTSSPTTGSNGNNGGNNGNNGNNGGNNGNNGGSGTESEFITVYQPDKNFYIVYDRNGVPLGWSNIENVTRRDQIYPFATDKPSTGSGGNAGKPNPKTGTANDDYTALFVIGLFAVYGITFFGLKARKSNR